MSVSDVSGKAIANLATEELSHPNPVFHGDTLFCETEVLDVKPSKSKLDRGIVKVHTRVLNQDGVLVAEFKRLVLVPRREHGEATARRRRRLSGRGSPEPARAALVAPVGLIRFEVRSPRTSRACRVRGHVVASAELPSREVPPLGSPHAHRFREGI